MAANQITANPVKGLDAQVANLASSKQVYFSVQNGLTALVGGAQAGTAITAGIARFTTVASAGDSAQLPVSEPGLEITVINSGANSMNVFGKTGDTINALSANAAFAVAAGKTATFTCPVAGKWFVVLSA